MILTELLKQWRDTQLDTPQYQPGRADGPLFRSLGELKWYQQVPE